MKKFIVFFCILSSAISSVAFADTIISCHSNDQLKRSIVVTEQGDAVVVTIANISQEFLNGTVGGYGNLELLKKVRSEYDSGELFNSLNSSNSSIQNNILRVEYKKDDCSFNPIDKMVIRCMKNGNVGVLIESAITRTISAFGIDITSKFLTVELSIARKGDFNGNVGLKNLQVSSSNTMVNSYSICR